MQRNSFTEFVACGTEVTDQALVNKVLLAFDTTPTYQVVANDL